MSLKLYDLPIAWANLQDALEASGGELTPEIQALWDQIQDEGSTKVDSAACVLRHLKAQEEALGTEIDRLQARKSACTNATERLRAMMLPAVEVLGGKVKTERFTVYTTTRKGYAIELAPGHDVWELDQRFYRTREPELSKTEIKKALDAGEAVPDALTVVATTSTSLTVR